MDKLSELKAAAMAATPGPWFVHEKPCEDGNYGIDTSDNEWTAEAVVWWGFARESIWREEDARFIAAANPAAVLALLAELEAKALEGRCIEQERELFRVERTAHQQHAQELEKRIAELEAIRAAAEKLVRCKGRYHSEQNYRALSALFGVTTPDLQPADGDSEAVIAELRAKLATPVRLSQRYETAGYCIDEHYCQEAADGDYLDRDELIASLHEQGFTVEGEDA